MKALKTLLLLFLLITPFVIHADDTVDEIQAKLQDKNDEIARLGLEIAQFNKELDKTATESKTLQNAVKTLDLTAKKISTDLLLTQSKINKSELTIKELSSGIKNGQEKIDLNKKVLANLFREIDSMQNSSFIELALKYKNVGDVWNQIDRTSYIQDSIQKKSKEIVNLVDDLTERKEKVQKEKNNLLNYNKDLKGQKVAVVETTKQKNQLLVETKNKEQDYKQIIADRTKKIEDAQKELFEIESQLNIAVDRSSYPIGRAGILSWPLDTIFITQLFGKTVDSQRLYKSGSHNGVDFRASVGTRVKAPLSGIILGTGNTDVFPGCYSYGKWVMIKHPNGLSSVFGHLSSIAVVPGQTVGTGDIIGYSGNTGYSIGPHLHVSLFASQGVKIQQYTQSIGCKKAVIPLGDVKAYLDPMAYFPTYSIK